MALTIMEPLYILDYLIIYLIDLNLNGLYITVSEISLLYFFHSIFSFTKWVIALL